MIGKPFLISRLPLALSLADDQQGVAVYVQPANVSLQCSSEAGYTCLVFGDVFSAREIPQHGDRIGTWASSGERRTAPTPLPF